MSNILDRVASNSTFGLFAPSTTQEYFALRLAQKLDEPGTASHYVQLLERHSIDQLLTAYRNVAASHLDVARRFHQQLEHPKTGFHSASAGRLAAIRIDRRAIAIAIFSGYHLRHADGVHLSPSENKAVNTIATLLVKTLIRFPVEVAVLEPSPPDVQRTRLHESVLDVLRTEAMSTAEISKNEMFLAFAHPPLHSRKELRSIIGQIFPVLDQVRGTPWTYDAAALGLYFQTERLFNLNHTQS